MPIPFPADGSSYTTNPWLDNTTNRRWLYTPSINSWAPYAETTTGVRTNVLQHGVVNDGVTDCRAAIQTLLDDPTLCRSLYFPAGTYVIKERPGTPGWSLQGTQYSRLYVNQPFTDILFDSRAELLFASDSAFLGRSLIEVRTSNVRLEGGVLNGGWDFSGQGTLAIRNGGTGGSVIGAQEWLKHVGIFVNDIAYTSVVNGYDTDDIPANHVTIENIHILNMEIKRFRGYGVNLYGKSIVAVYGVSVSPSRSKGFRNITLEALNIRQCYHGFIADGNEYTNTWLPAPGQLLGSDDLPYMEDIVLRNVRIDETARVSTDLAGFYALSNADSLEGGNAVTMGGYVRNVLIDNLRTSLCGRMSIETGAWVHAGVTIRNSHLGISDYRTISCSGSHFTVEGCLIEDDRNYFEVFIAQGFLLRNNLIYGAGINVASSYYDFRYRNYTIEGNSFFDTEDYYPYINLTNVDGGRVSRNTFVLRNDPNTSWPLVVAAQPVITITGCSALEVSTNAALAHNPSPRQMLSVVGLSNSLVTKNTFAYVNHKGTANILPFSFNSISDSEISDNSLDIYQEASVTVTAANPAVVNWEGHGLNDGERFEFFYDTFAAGVLPSSLSVSQIYYVKNRTDDTFEVAATQNGTSISSAGLTPGACQARGYVRNSVAFGAYSIANCASARSEKWNGAQWVTTALTQFPGSTYMHGTPPVAPSAGQSFIVGSPATGAWAGKEAHIATWNGSAWTFDRISDMKVATTSGGVAQREERVPLDWPSTYTNQSPQTFIYIAGGLRNVRVLRNRLMPGNRISYGGYYPFASVLGNQLFWRCTFEDNDGPIRRANETGASNYFHCKQRTLPHHFKPTAFIEHTEGTFFPLLQAGPTGLQGWVKSGGVGSTTLIEVGTGEQYVSRGAGAPATTPEFIGQEYVDTTAGAVYKAVGIAAPTDWKLMG